MMRAEPWLVAVIASIGLMFSGSAGAATTFNFLFDDAGYGAPDGTIGSPIVGVGTFVSPVDLAPGLYSLASLPGYSFAAEVAGVSFTNADLTTPSSGVSVGITQVGAVQRLVFTETPGDPGADGGVIAGAADFDNVNGLLSFEPSYDGGNTEYVALTTGGPTFSGSSSLGNYLALSVPEPASWAMMLLGFGGLGAVLRHRALTTVRA